MHLRQFPAIDRLATDCKLLFEHAELLEPLRELKSDRELIDCPFQFDLNLKSHRRVSARAGKVLRLNKIAGSIRASGDFLQNLQCTSDGCLSNSVLSDQQDRRLTRDWQLKVLKASKVMNVQSSYHKRMIARLLAWSINNTAPASILLYIAHLKICAILLPNGLLGARPGVADMRFDR